MADIIPIRPTVQIGDRGTKGEIPAFVSSGVSGNTSLVDNAQELPLSLQVKYVRTVSVNEIAKSDGGEPMDESIKMLVDRMDKDLREHRQEIRDRDARLQSEFQEREKRTHDEVKEREERIISSLAEVKNESTSTKNTVIGLTISVILGVAAMVLAVVLSK
jgi:MoxR-like ATPase